MGLNIFFSSNVTSKANPAKIHQVGLKLLCCLAGKSKTALMAMTFMFFLCMGFDNLLDV